MMVKMIILIMIIMKLKLTKVKSFGVFSFLKNPL